MVNLSLIKHDIYNAVYSVKVNFRRASIINLCYRWLTFSLIKQGIVHSKKTIHYLRQKTEVVKWVKLPLQIKNLQSPYDIETKNWSNEVNEGEGIGGRRIKTSWARVGLNWGKERLKMKRIEWIDAWLVLLSVLSTHYNPSLPCLVLSLVSSFLK